MKAVYMGTPEIAAVILESLLKTDIEIAAVVTQPDKPKGRGKGMAAPCTKITAIKHGLKVIQPKKARSAAFIDEIRELAPDIIIVAAFGQILTKPLLEMPKFGCINVHASLLPRYRGAAPIQRAVINGDKTSGITIMYMNEGIDTGDIILTKELTLDRKETGGSLHDKLAVLGFEALKEALIQIEAGTAKRIPQEDIRPYNPLEDYAPMLAKADGRIDFSLSADKLERLIRGLNPWPSAFTYYHNKLLKLWDTEALTDYKPAAPYQDAKCGTIVECGKDYIYVMTGTGVLRLNELQPEGKRKMQCGEFLRGYHIKEGDCFG